MHPRTLRVCCQLLSVHHATCYRSQVLATTRALAARAGMAADRYSVSFQSRLAGEPWCQPFTDAELARLPRLGAKRLLVICPAFVADCLETLEEVSEAGKKVFFAAGGASFQPIPCLNDQEPYINFLAGRVERWVAARNALQAVHDIRRAKRGLTLKPNLNSNRGSRL